MNPPEYQSAAVTMQVPFYDLDPLHVVWHGNYLNYFELARDAIFQRANVDLYSLYEAEQIALPVVRSNVKYVRALAHRDEIQITARVVDAKRKLVFRFLITRVSDGAICAKGSTEHVAMKMPEKELQLHIPERIRQALQI